MPKYQSGSNSIVPGYASPGKLLATVAAAVFFVEISFMLTLHGIFGLSDSLSALLDATVLVLIISPLLYFLVYRPFTVHLEKRRKLETELERLFTMPLDMICIAGGDGCFKKVNPAFTAILGFSEEEMLARPFTDFIHPDDRHATSLEVEKQLKGEATLDFENRYLCKDGSYRWLSWKAVSVPQNGDLYATARDITKRKSAEEALRLESEITAHAAEGIALIRARDGVISVDSEPEEWSEFTVTLPYGPFR